MNAKVWMLLAAHSYFIILTLAHSNFGRQSLNGHCRRMNKIIRSHYFMASEKAFFDSVDLFDWLHKLVRDRSLMTSCKFRHFLNPFLFVKCLCCKPCQVSPPRSLCDVIYESSQSEDSEMSHFDFNETTSERTVFDKVFENHPSKIFSVVFSLLFVPILIPGK